MDDFYEKCKIIFNIESKEVSTLEEIEALEKMLDIKIDEKIRYIIMNYANCFLNEKYAVCSVYQSPICDKKYGTEPFLFFLGTSGKNNYRKIYETYRNQIPNKFFPIALSDGGNLLCMEKQTSNIYIWIHDDVQNCPYKIFDSIEQMIMHITKVNRDEDDFSGCIPGKPSAKALKLVEEWKKKNNML